MYEQQNYESMIFSPHARKFFGALKHKKYVAEAQRRKDAEKIHFVSLLCVSAPLRLGDCISFQKAE
jgi:hypothetical protein